MEDPVTTEDGFSYCRVCILEFSKCDEKAILSRRGREPDRFETILLAPATSLPLASRELIPNMALRQAIESYKYAKNELARLEQQHRLLQAQFESARATICELQGQVRYVNENAQTGALKPVAAQSSMPPHLGLLASSSTAKPAAVHGEDLEVTGAEPRLRKPLREPPPTPATANAEDSAAPPLHVEQPELVAAELAVFPANPTINAKEEAAELKRIGNNDATLAAATSGKLLTALLRSEPVSGSMEDPENDAAEQLDLDPPAEKQAKKLAGSKKKSKKKKPKRIGNDDDAVLAAAMQQAKLEEEVLRNSKTTEAQGMKDPRLNGPEDISAQESSFRFSSEENEEDMSSALEEMKEMFDEEMEEERKGCVLTICACHGCAGAMETETTTGLLGKCMRLWLAVRRFTSGSDDKNSFLQLWHAVDASKVKQEIVLLQLVRHGFEQKIRGPKNSRIVSALLTLLKNDAISWSMMEKELTAGFNRSFEKARVLGNIFHVPEFYEDFIVELLTMKLQCPPSLQGVLEPLLRSDYQEGDKEMVLETIVSVLMKVKASKGLPGLRDAVLRLESARVELNLPSPTGLNHSMLFQ
jgi:hypothetical protein